MSVNELKDFLGDNSIIINVGEKKNTGDKAVSDDKIKQSFIIDKDKIVLVDVHNEQSYSEIYKEIIADKEFGEKENVIFMGNYASNWEEINPEFKENEQMLSFEVDKKECFIVGTWLEEKKNKPASEFNAEKAKLNGNEINLKDVLDKVNTLASVKVEEEIKKRKSSNSGEEGSGGEGSGPQSEEQTAYINEMNEKFSDISKTFVSDIEVPEGTPTIKFDPEKKEGEFDNELIKQFNEFTNQLKDGHIDETKKNTIKLGFDGIIVSINSLPGIVRMTLNPRKKLVKALNFLINDNGDESIKKELIKKFKKCFSNKDKNFRYGVYDKIIENIKGHNKEITQDNINLEEEERIKNPEEYIEEIQKDIDNTGAEGNAPAPAEGNASANNAGAEGNAAQGNGSNAPAEDNAGSKGNGAPARAEENGGNESAGAENKGNGSAAAEGNAAAEAPAPEAPAPEAPAPEAPAVEPAENNPSGEAKTNAPANNPEAPAGNGGNEPAEGGSRKRRKGSRKRIKRNSRKRSRRRIRSI